MRQKVPKNSAHGKNLHKCPLFTPHTVSLQSDACSSLQAIVCFLGAAELDLHGYIRKVIPVQIFRQSSHNGLKTSGPPLDFSTVPFRRWRGITFAMKIHWFSSRFFVRQKARIERLEDNISERTRLNTAVEYNYRRTATISTLNFY